MDIKDILNSLGLDLKNPEAKRGAIEAIQAILNSRVPPPDISGGSSDMGAPPEGLDVDIDPELLQPSQKFNTPDNDEDVEIIHEVNKTLVVINDDYRKMVSKDQSKSSPYSLLNEEVENLQKLLLINDMKQVRIGIIFHENYKDLASP